MQRTLAPIPLLIALVVLANLATQPALADQTVSCGGQGANCGKQNVGQVCIFNGRTGTVQVNNKFDQLTEKVCVIPSSLAGTSGGYVNVADFGDYDSLAGDVFQSSTFGGDRTPALGGTSVDSANHVEAGVFLNVTEYLALSLGLGFGSGEVDQEVLVAGNRGVARSDFDVVTGRLDARFYPLPTESFRPWVSAGILGVALRPDATRTEVSLGPEALTLEGLEDTDTVDFVAGVGFDVKLNNRFSLTVLGQHGSETGWRAGVGLSGGTAQLFKKKRYTYVCEATESSAICCTGLFCGSGNNDERCRGVARRCIDGNGNRAPLDLEEIRRP